MSILHECGAPVPEGAIVCGTCGGTVDPETVAAPHPSAAPAVATDPSVQHPTDPADAEQTGPAEAGALVCPTLWCGRPSPAGSVECAFCGEPLAVVPPDTDVAGQGPAPRGTAGVFEDCGDPVAVLLVLPDGARLELPSGRSLLVGRESDHPQVRRALAPYDGVSRRHARIVLDGAALRVEDLGSTNGTWIDDQPVAPRLDVDLFSAGVLRLGSFARIHLLPASPGGST